MDLSFTGLNFDSVETLPGIESRAALSSMTPASTAAFATAASSASTTAKYSLDFYVLKHKIKFAYTHIYTLLLQKNNKMKKTLILIISLAWFCNIGQAQYYNPYNNSYANQQAYEWGRRMAEEQKMRERKNPNSCLRNIVYNIAIRNLSTAEDWANSMAEVNEANGYYYIGLVNELMGQTTYAKKMYQNSINAGNTNARQWLIRLNREGELSKSQKENIYNYYLNLYSNVTNAAAAMANDIWNGSSSSGSNRRSSSRSSSSCSKCNGTGWEKKRYVHATGTYYYNSPGSSCPICGYSDKHYHYKCYH